jgi:hypothetical protein
MRQQLALCVISMPRNNQVAFGAKRCFTARAICSSTRHPFIHQQIAVIDSIRAHLAEFGIVAPAGRKGVTELLHIVADTSDKRVSEVVRACLAALGTQLLSINRFWPAFM